MAKSGSIPGENALIEALRSRLRPVSARESKVSLGMGDDCAIIQPPRGNEILVTTDFSLETIHFHRDWHSPESVGHRCLARGLSDLAAMGAQPLAAFLSLALPEELVRSTGNRPSWRDRFLAGFLALADQYDVPLAGGDTARSPRYADPSINGSVSGLALADIVLIGSAPRGYALLRSGAKLGDHIYVTGHLGGAAAELQQLETTPARFRRCIAPKADDPNPHPHLFPEPRIAVGLWLKKKRRATAAIDISDGLSTDLNHLCEESGLAATLDAAAIPLHPLANASAAQQKGSEALQLALNGGEDYELLFTASPSTRIPRRIAGVPITPIGHMLRYKSRAPRMLLTELVDGKLREQPMQPGGWEHYKYCPE